MATKAVDSIQLYQSDALTTREQRDLARAEHTIARGLKSFLAVGVALKEIRDKRLYRQQYDTFEEYCIRRWELSRPRAYELCAASEVVADLSANADIGLLPENEAQARPLARLKMMEDRQRAWAMAVRLAATQGRSVTARDTEEAVRKLNGSFSAEPWRDGEPLTGMFRTVLSDPPWPYDSTRAAVGNAGRGAQYGRAATIVQADVLAHYAVMSVEEIKALPVKSHVEDNAHLYLWTTNSFMVEAHEVARDWGFEPKTIITWVKTYKDNPTRPSMKTGYWYRSATEHILFAVRGSLPLRGPAAPTAVLSPRLPHSVKPQWCYQLIEQQSPGPYLELFARNIRAGWDAWGDQIRVGT
jgi:N6-adenosine-specific RNA methylase IME4